MYGNTYRDLCAAAVIVVGFLAVWLMYKKAGKVAGF
jgi:hypothetical protein